MAELTAETRRTQRGGEKRLWATLSAPPQRPSRLCGEAISHKRVEDRFARSNAIFDPQSSIFDPLSSS
jgi:hypothetical protein